MLSYSIVAQDYKEFIKNVPGNEKFPDAAVINVYTKIAINLNADGSYTKKVFYIKKILTYKGKKQYADVKISYNANFATVELGDCFSVRNGKRMEIPKEGYHDNEGYMTFASPEFVNVREKVINFPAIEPGDFIVVNYTETNKPRLFFSGLQIMRTTYPFLNKEFSISTPKSIHLNYSFDESKVKFEKMETDDKKIYKWSVENMPMIKNEINKPSIIVLGYPVLYSVMDNWQEAANKVFKQYNSEDYNTEQVRKLSREITKGQKDEKGKLLSIYKYMQDNYLSKYSFADDGFKVNGPLKVIERKYGDNHDLTALFAALVKSAGVKIQTALFVAHNEDVKGFKDVPLLSYIDKMVLVYNGKLLAADNSYYPFGYIGKEEGFYIPENNKKEIKIYKYNIGKLVERKVVIDVDKDKMAMASFETTLRGRYDYNLRSEYKNETDKKRKIWFAYELEDRSMLMKSGPDFENLDNPDKDVKVRYSTLIQHFGLKQDKYFYFTLPEVQRVSMRIAGKTRENPYEISNSVSIYEEYIVKNLPANFKVIKPATPVYYSLKINGKQMFISVSYKIKDGNVLIIREVNIPKNIIPVADYKEFYSFAIKLKNPINKMVFVFE